MNTKAALAIKAIIWLMDLRGIKWIISGFFRFVLAPRYTDGDELTLGLSHRPGCELRHIPEMNLFEAGPRSMADQAHPGDPVCENKNPPDSFGHPGGLRAS